MYVEMLKNFSYKTETIAYFPLPFVRVVASRIIEISELKCKSAWT